MDQRRVLAFVLLSIGLLMLSHQLFPPPPPPEADEQAAPAVDRPRPDAELRQGGDAPRPLDDDPGADAEIAPPAADAPAEQARDVPLELVTLGSLDRDAGYRMLLTLTNRGAAVQRAEMTSPRFRDLHDRSGYLGHLALVPIENGLQVGIVGPGTPAAKAGIEVGDVLVGVDASESVDLHTVDELQAALADTRPNREITLRVVRGGGPVQSIVVKLARRPLEVVRPEIENIHMRSGTIPDGFVDPPSFLMTLANLDGRRLEGEVAEQLAAWLQEGHWEITDRSESSVTFERPIPERRLKIVKRYVLQPVPPASRANENYPGYDFRLEVEIQNTGDAPQSVAYQLDGPTGLPLEGWWYAHKISQQHWFGGAGLRDVGVRFQGSGKLQIDGTTIHDDKSEPMGEGRSLAYVGVDSVYFASMIIPQKESLDEIWFDTAQAIRVGPKLDDRTPKTYANVTCRLTRKPIDLPPGTAHRESFQIFVGPKRPELLIQYKAADDPNYTLRDIVYYGMTPFGNVARAMLVILHFFYGLVGNYGLAIIMLTIVVRGAMFPISYKQTKNMARMQALKPEMDRIAERYKGDMQKRSQAINDLYRKHKINPLGGCLPLLLQLPIFIGLYRSIMIDVELRQTPLFSHAIRWCSDLSAPDMLFDWSGIMPDFVNHGIGIMGLGPYFNVLPIVTVLLFLVSMKMSMPAPTSEQAVMQQKIMKYMTGFMAILFYKVASGLCIYFIASSLWGIGERKLLVNARAVGEPPSDAATGTTPTRGPTSSGGRPPEPRNGSPGKKRRPKNARRKR